jgi:hypothetical protein
MCQVELMKLRVKCSTPNEVDYMFVMWKKKGQIGICKTCWEKIGNKNWECGDRPRPTFESLFTGRGLEGAVLTEYKVKDTIKESLENEEEEY